MITRTYKNHNFSIKHENAYDGPAPETIEELICKIANDIDAPDVESADESNWGNAYRVYECVMRPNGGAPYYYTITPDDLKAYQAGRVVRLIAQGPALLHC